MGLPRTLPPKSSTAIFAAVTEPWPVGVDPGPLMSVSTPILTTSSETCASAAVEVSIARANAASRGKYLLSIRYPPVAVRRNGRYDAPGPLGRASQSQMTGRFSGPQRGAHLLPEAGAAQERTLEAVRCSALLKIVGAMASSPFQCLLRLRQRLPPIHHERLTRDKACLFRG